MSEIEKLDAFVFKSTKFEPDGTEIGNLFPNLSLVYLEKLINNLKMSSQIVNSINEEVIVSIVLPIYDKDKNLKEDNFVLRRIKQFAWLFQENKLIKWKLYLVDYSGDRKIQSLLNENKHLERYRESYSIVNARCKNLSGLLNYGMKSAVEEYMEYYNGLKHFLVSCNEGMNLHLSQLGLLFQPLLNVKFGVVTTNTFTEVSKRERQMRDICFPHVMRGHDSNGVIVMTGNLFGSGSEAITPFTFNIDFLLKSTKFKGENFIRYLKVDKHFSKSFKKTESFNLSEILKTFFDLVKKYEK